MAWRRADVHTIGLYIGLRGTGDRVEPQRRTDSNEAWEPDRKTLNGETDVSPLKLGHVSFFLSASKEKKGKVQKKPK